MVTDLPLPEKMERRSQSNTLKRAKTAEKVLLVEEEVRDVEVVIDVVTEEGGEVKVVTVEEKVKDMSMQLMKGL